MIEQINIALEQKGSGFLAWVIEACRRRLTSKREHIHQLKVMKKLNIRVLPSEQDDIVNSSLDYEGIAVTAAVLPLSWIVTDCVLALSQTK